MRKPARWSDCAGRVGGSGAASGAFWHSEGRTGAVLKYEALVREDDPGKILSGFLEQVQQQGATLMTGRNR